MCRSRAKVLIVLLISSQVLLMPCVQGPHLGAAKQPGNFSKSSAFHLVLLLTLRHICFNSKQIFIVHICGDTVIKNFIKKMVITSTRSSLLFLGCMCFHINTSAHWSRFRWKRKRHRRVYCYKDHTIRAHMIDVSAHRWRY